MKNEQIPQMSDSKLVYIPLALSGGCMDAYSYLCRGKVFANAQTGNLLLLGVNIAEGNFSTALNYFIPIVAFVAGIILSDAVRKFWGQRKIHWRQCSTVLELFLLLAVSFLPPSANGLANALASLACGIQVESFRTMGGLPIATTMCIGNLRSGTYNLGKFFETGDKNYKKKSFLYYEMILFFIAGAVIESVLIRLFAEKSILLSVALLLAVCLMMSKKAVVSPQGEQPVSC